MTGTITKSSVTNNLCIDGTSFTQKGVTLRESDIIIFKLKEGDTVSYDGIPCTTVFVTHKLVDGVYHNSQYFTNQI